MLSQSILSLVGPSRGSCQIPTWQEFNRGERIPRDEDWLPIRSNVLRLQRIQGQGTPPFVLVRRGVGAKGHSPLIARDEIDFPSLPSLPILKEFIKRRVAAFLEILVGLQPVISLLPASVVDSDGSFCTFNHARRLNAFMQMQNTFAGIKPYCDVCNPITQTMRLLTPETTRPVHNFLPTRIVATTVRKQDR